MSQRCHERTHAPRGKKYTLFVLVATGEQLLRWSFGQPGLPFLIAARNGFIIWLNLVLIPAEFAFDMIKAELERRGIRYD